MFLKVLEIMEAAVRRLSALCFKVRKKQTRGNIPACSSLICTPCPADFSVGADTQTNTENIFNAYLSFSSFPPYDGREWLLAFEIETLLPSS